MSRVSLRALPGLTVFAAAAIPLVPMGGSVPPPVPPPNPAIAYQSGGTLYVMNADGSNQRVVVTAATTKATMEPAWSPRGDEIAFCGTPGGQPNGIWAVRPDGSGLRRIATLPAGFDSDLSWSPTPTLDGREKVAFIVPSDVSATPYYYEVFLANADGSGVAQLTNTEDHEMDVAWAPDGRRLVVTALAMQNGGKPYAAVLDLALDTGGQLTVSATLDITMLPGSPLLATSGVGWLIRDPDWARNSSRVLLSVRKPGFGDDLWIVDLANPTQPVRLDSNGAAEFFGCWSPDDSQICYRVSSGRRNALGIYRMAANGTSAVQLQSGGAFPDWKRIP